MGRLKKYNLYKFETLNGKFIKSSRRVNMRNRSLKELIRIGRKHGYKKANLPLPLNKYSTIVGVVKDNMYKVNLLSQRRSYEYDYTVAEYLRIRHPELYNKLIDSGIKVYSGDWCNTHRNIHNMCGDERDFWFTYKELVDGYFSRVGIDLVLPDLSNYSPEYILGLGINPKANSGHLTSRLINSKRKISTQYTKEAAVYYAKEIMESSELTFDKSLTSIGGREKRVAVDIDVNKEYRTRGINNPEDIPTLISQSIAKPINETLQKINKGFNYGGRINGGKNFEKFLQEHDCDKDMININPDFSEHDGSVHEVNAVTAMAFLRCCFPVCDKLDKLFIYILSSVIYRRFVLPESGLVYEITKGLSTGHGLTSIMTSLVAYGTMACAIHKTHNDRDIKRTKIINAGDDVTGKVLMSKLSMMNDVVLKRSGFKMDNLHDYCGYFIADHEDLKCTFLKKNYGGGRLRWNFPELMTNLLTPTMSRKGFSRIIDNIKQMIFQAPLDYYTNNSLKTIFVMQALEWFGSSRRNKDIGKPNYNYELFIDKLIRTSDRDYDPMLLIKDLPLKHDSVYNPTLGDYYPMDTKQYIITNLLNIDNIITTKSLWFRRNMYADMHRITMRLAIFDIGKIVTIPRGYYIRINRHVYRE